MISWQKQLNMWMQKKTWQMKQLHLPEQRISLQRTYQTMPVTEQKSESLPCKGRLISTAKDPKAESVYEMYYEFDEALSKVAGHRTLAINRGEKEKILTVKIEAPTEDIIKYLKKQVITMMERLQQPYSQR